MVSDEIDFHVMNIKKIGDIMNLSPYKVLKNHQNPPVRRVPMKNPAKKSCKDYGSANDNVDDKIGQCSVDALSVNDCQDKHGDRNNSNHPIHPCPVIDRRYGMGYLNCTSNHNRRKDYQILLSER